MASVRRKSLRRAGGVLGLVLCAAPTASATEPGAIAAPDCAFDPQRSHQTAREIAERLSRTTERVRPSRLASPLSRRVPGPPPRGPAYPSFVDAEIFGTMAAHGVPPTTRSSDTEFLRRVTLDLTGQIPDPATVQAFLADIRNDKRDRMIDTLLHAPAFVDRWTLWFGDLVENVQRTSAMGFESYKGRNQYYLWIAQSIADGKPYDQMARELVTGSGDNFVSGPPNYWVRQIQSNGPEQDTYDNLFAHAAEKFHGTQAFCLSCHNGAGHTDLINVFLSTKTRVQFWQSAAFFAQTVATSQNDGGTDFLKWVISERTSGGGYLLNTDYGNKSPRAPAPGQPSTVEPVFYLTGEKPAPGKPLRAEFARMLTEEPQFARAAVNYVWKELFGLGLVEPANNFDLLRQDPNNLPPGWSVQPSHPVLLDKLALSFRTGGYDLRALIRTIVASDAYQLSAAYTPGNWKAENAVYLPRRLLRRLPAEMLFDAIVSATGVPPAPLSGVTYTGITSLGAQDLPTITRAVALPDPTEGGGSALFLNLFGRGNRDGLSRSPDVSAVQALLMLNDGNIVTRCKNSTIGSTVQRSLKATSDPAVIVETLYLSTLGRYPSDTERTRAVAYLRSGTLASRTEDLQFALLNELEFLHN